MEERFKKIQNNMTKGYLGTTILLATILNLSKQQLASKDINMSSLESMIPDLEEISSMKVTQATATGNCVTVVFTDTNWDSYSTYFKVTISGEETSLSYSDPQCQEVANIITVLYFKSGFFADAFEQRLYVLNSNDPNLKFDFEAYFGTYINIFTTDSFDSIQIEIDPVPSVGATNVLAMDYVEQGTQSILFGANEHDQMYKIYISSDLQHTVEYYAPAAFPYTYRMFDATIVYNDEGVVLTYNRETSGLYKFNAYDLEPAVQIEIKNPDGSDYEDNQDWDDVFITKFTNGLKFSSLQKASDIFSIDSAITRATRVDRSKLSQLNEIMIFHATEMSIDSPYYDQDKALAVFAMDVEDPGFYIALGGGFRILEQKKNQRKLTGVNDVFGIYLLDPSTLDQILFFPLQNPGFASPTPTQNFNYMDAIKSVYEVSGILYGVNSNFFIQEFDFLDFTGIPGCTQNYEPGVFLSGKCAVCDATPGCTVYVPPVTPPSVTPATTQSLLYELAQKDFDSYSDVVLKLSIIFNTGSVVDYNLILPPVVTTRRVFTVTDTGTNEILDSYIGFDNSGDMAIFINTTTTIKQLNPGYLDLLFQSLTIPEQLSEGQPVLPLIFNHKNFRAKNLKSKSGELNNFEFFVTYLLNQNHWAHELVSFIVLFLDPTSISFLSILFLKLANKLVFFSIGYDGKLQSFLQKAIGVSSPRVNKRLLLEQDEGQGPEEDFKGKFTRFRTPEILEGKLIWKSTLYLFSWFLLCIERIFILPCVRKSLKKNHIKCLNIERKIRFTIFKVSSIDIVFLGARVLVHDRLNLDSLVGKLAIIVCYILLTIDLYKVYLNIIEIRESVLKLEKAKPASEMGKDGLDLDKKKFRKQRVDQEKEGGQMRIIKLGSNLDEGDLPIEPELAESVDLEHDLNIRKDKKKSKDKGRKKKKKNKKDKKVRKDDIDSWDFHFKKDKEEKKRSRGTRDELNLQISDQWEIAGKTKRKNKGGNNKIGTKRARIFPKKPSQSIEGANSEDMSREELEVLFSIEINQELKKFNLSLLKDPKKKLEQRKSNKIFKEELIGNFLYLMIRLAFQVIIVSLPHFTYLQLSLIMAIEILYIGYNIFSFTKFRNYQTIVVPISKIYQSIMLFAITVHILIVNKYVIEGKDIEKMQKKTMNLVIAGVIGEVIFLGINMGLKVYIEKRSKNKEPVKVRYN